MTKLIHSTTCMPYFLVIQKDYIVFESLIYKTHKVCTLQNPPTS